jgi:predicted exporter
MDEHTPDPRLVSALRSVEAEPPVDEVDWDALRAGLNARAELPLARLRARASAGGSGAPAAVRRPVRGGARVVRWLVPLAAAAGLGGLLLALPGDPLHPGGGRTAGVPVATTGQAAPEVQAILDETIPDRVDHAIDGAQSDEDAVLTGALGG